MNDLLENVELHTGEQEGFIFPFSTTWLHL